MEHSLPHREDSTESMGDAQLLATMLEWSGKPPLESQELARTLLDDLGSLPAILIDPSRLLRLYPQIGVNEAALFRLYLELMGQYLARNAAKITRPRSLSQVYQLLLPYFYNQAVEQVYALFLDGDGKLLGGAPAAHGDGGAVSLPSAWILEEVTRRSARGVILAHNHPDGLCVFSQVDVVSTMKLARQLQAIGVRLWDHYLLARLQIFSLRQQLELAPDAPWPSPETVF